VFPSAGQNHPEELKVFYWNKDLKKWELVGGTYENGQIKASTNHFSTFAVFHPKDLAKKPSVESDLPSTATNMYNWLFAGLLVIVLGGSMVAVRRLRQKEE
jgi:LPXTG-motif cell wall-anchored protein